LPFEAPKHNQLRIKTVATCNKTLKKPKHEKKAIAKIARGKEGRKERKLKRE